MDDSFFVCLSVQKNVYAFNTKKIATYYFYNNHYKKINIFFILKKKSYYIRNRRGWLDLVKAKLVHLFLFFFFHKIYSVAWHLFHLTNILKIGFDFWKKHMPEISDQYVSGFYKSSLDYFQNTATATTTTKLFTNFYRVLILKTFMQICLN